MTAGLTADQACSAILFTVSVGADYQVEMSKLRAARRMWGRVAEAFGAKGASAAMKLQAVTSRRMLTRRDPWVNILRNTAACFAAGVGGADIVTVRAFTDAMGLPGKLGFDGSQVFDAWKAGNIAGIRRYYPRVARHELRVTLLRAPALHGGTVVGTSHTLRTEALRAPLESGEVW